MKQTSSSARPVSGFAKLLFLSLLFSLSFQIQAQTNTFPPNGYVGIGTTTPGFALTAIGTDWNSSQISLTTYAGSPTPGGTDNYTPQFRFEKARGTAATPTQVVNGDRIGAFLAAGFDGSKMQRSAVFGFRVDDATSAGNVPIGFFVQTGNASANKPERFLVKSNGEVVIKDLGVSLGDRMVAVDDTGLLFTMPLPTGGGGPVALNDLTDVNTAGAVNGSVIKYNGASWAVGSDNVNDADASPTNELQNLSSSSSGTNRTINISGGTGTTISVADNDNSATNEIQTLSLAANTLSLTGGGSVNLAGYLDNTDAQTLSINAAGTLSISGGNSVNVFDSDWLYFSGSGNSGNIYHAGDAAMGTFTDPDGHGLNVQNYTSGHGAVRGADQSGSSLYAEGMLGVLSPGLTGAPISMSNAGVMGIKPALGGNGAAVYGWNDDVQSSNYGGLFVSDGPGGTNYAVYADADSGSTNYAGYFKGRVNVQGNNSSDGAADSLSTLLSATVNHNISVDTRAVEGTSTPNPGFGFGGYFNGGYRGVYGLNSGADYSGASIGVYGNSSGTAGTRYGVYGYAGNSGGNTAIGVYGSANGATNNWAGYFSGRTYISGDVGIGTTITDADVYIDANRDTAVYVVQNNTSSSGTHYAVRVDNNPATTGTSYGYYTERTTGGNGSRYGFRNYMTGGTGTRYGFSSSIYADVANTSTVYGLYSFVSSASTTGTSYAGYFANGSADNEYSVYAAGRSYFSNKVMIATTIPATNYELSVNGQIACEEVLVQNNTSWPDYVFADDYELPSLDEFEDHIQTHKHLPGVPSASEMEENGILIGDMQVRTIEKVEELSLYILQLHNQMKEMNERMLKLENENAELKSGLTK